MQTAHDWKRYYKSFFDCSVVIFCPPVRNNMRVHMDMDISAPTGQLTQRWCPAAMYVAVVLSDEAGKDIVPF